jgi:hypothetical protein
MSDLKPTGNYVPPLHGKSNANDGADVVAWLDPTTHRLLVDSSSSIDTTGLASDSNQTDGSQKTQIVDGSGNVIGATSNALDVNIASGSASGTEYTEDDAAAANPAGGALIMIRDDALSGQTTTDGDNVAARGTDKGELYVKHTDALSISGTVTVDGSGVTQPVSGTVTANLSATDNAVLDQIELNTDPLLVVGGGTEATAQRVTIANDSTGVVSVDDNGGALTVDGTVTAELSATDNAVLDNIDSDTSTIATNTGTVAGAVSGSEMQVDVVAALPAGTNAIGKLAANDGVDIGDVGIQAGTASIGKLLPPDTDVTAHTNYAKKYYTSAGAATDGIIWSPGAGKRWHVVSLIINVSAAATVTLEDDLAGGDSAVWKAELAANSGLAINFSEKYPLASGEDAADLTITTTAGNVYVTVTGYEI